MGKKDYAVGVAINVEYNTDGFKSGETVIMEIFDETFAKDLVNFPDVTMTERAATPIYDGSFTPDAQGEWLVLCYYGSGKGKRIKKFSVGGYNLDSVGQKIDTIVSQTTGLDSPAKIGQKPICMSVTITLRYHENAFQLFYASTGFQEGLIVTGYVIYPDMTKSNTQEFDELGDGIYSGLFPFEKKSNNRIERYGIVMKENGIVKLFEIINLIT